MSEEIDIPDEHIYILPMGKIRRFIHHWNNGRRDHFPICCIIRFALEDAKSDGKMIPIKEASGEKRGSVTRGNDTTFVPCNIFHFAEKTSRIMR